MIGPSLNGMGVGVSVGVKVWVNVGVNITEKVSVSVGVPVSVGVDVLVDVRVEVGVNVLVKVGVGLMKNARTEGFEESSQAATTTIPSKMLSTQKPITTRPSDFDEGAGITLLPVRCSAANPAPC
jgi:hypothetical protein